MDTWSWPVLHKCKISSKYSKHFSSYGADTKLHLKLSREINSESMKVRVVILVCDTLSWPVLHNCEVSPKYSKVMEQTWNCIWNHQGEITQKVLKRELSFLYTTHGHDLFYITVKYHDYIPKGIQVAERTWICIKKHQRGDNWKSIKGWALSFVLDTLSRPVLHNWGV